MDLNLGNDVDRDNSTKGKDEDRAPTNLSVVIGTSTLSCSKIQGRE